MRVHDLALLASLSIGVFDAEIRQVVDGNLIVLPPFLFHHRKICVLPQPFCMEHKQYTTALTSQLLHDSVDLSILEMAALTILIIITNICTIDYNIKGRLFVEPLAEPIEVVVWPPPCVREARREGE